MIFKMVTGEIWPIIFGMQQFNPIPAGGGGGGRKVPAPISTFENSLDI